MELKQLRAFVAVAEELHFGRAAQREHTVQSAISDHIGKLERELGVQLFERNPREVHLTDAGTAFLRPARITLQRLRGAAGLAAVASGEGPGDIRVGFMGAGVDSWLPEIVALYRQALPESRVIPYDVLADARGGGLREGLTDVAFVFSITSRPLPEFSSEVLRHEPSCLLVPDDHEFATAERVDFSDVDIRQLVGTTGSAFRPRGRMPRANTLEEYADYVALGGLAIGPLSLARRYSRAGTVVVGLDGGPTYQHLLAWKDNGRRVVEEFVAATRSVVRRHDPADPATPPG